MSLRDLLDTPAWPDYQGETAPRTSDGDIVKQLYRDSSPKYARESCWTYETPEGLVICVQHHDNDGNKTRAFQYLIPWRQLGAMVHRREK